jgi:ComF family protein
MSVPSHAEDVWWPEAVSLTDTAHQPAVTSRTGWRDRAVAAARRAGDAVTGLLYPPACLACPVLTGAPGGLCPACWQAMPVIDRPYCERLGTPFALDIGGTLLSPAAIAEPPVFARARAVARFEGTARILVHRLKYGDRLDLAPSMGRWMARAGAEVLNATDALVPVPLHRWRLWRRRFNQAGALAAAVGRESNLPVWHDVLLRGRATRSQVGLTRAERARNLQGVFRVPPEARPALKGRRVVLVDDVMTTGSTGNAAARALIRGGAAQVDLLLFAVVAHAP